LTHFEIFSLQALLCAGFDDACVFGTHREYHFLA